MSYEYLTIFFKLNISVKVTLYVFVFYNRVAFSVMIITKLKEKKSLKFDFKIKYIILLREGNQETSKFIFDS